MKTTTKQTHLYSNTDLRKLLIPIIIEQLLSSLMGTVDTMMVSNVGSAAISAVSLVDSINILVIQALSALAAGGAILCSQYIGSEKRDGAIRSAQQVLFVMTVLSVALSAGCLIFRVPLLRDFRGSGSGCYEKFTGVFPVYAAVIPVYRSLRCGRIHSAGAEQQPQSDGDFGDFQLYEHRRKCHSYFRLPHGCRRSRDFDFNFAYFLCGCRTVEASG